MQKPGVWSSNASRGTDTFPLSDVTHTGTAVDVKVEKSMLYSTDSRASDARAV
jgi:hypothetical protein